MSEASPKNLVDAAHLVCCSAAALLSSRCCCCVANKVCYHLLSPLPAVAVAVVGVANLARYNFLGLTFVLIHLGYFFFACLATLFFRGAIFRSHSQQSVGRGRAATAAAAEVAPSCCCRVCDDSEQNLFPSF